ncbi:Gti1/Pac2 family-domain-containing protein, partial [Emericellopsis atlantica]
MANNSLPSHSGGNTTGGLLPTFEGEVYTTFDALILFEACLSGKFNHCPRRPHDRERPQLIKSGHIFVYEEESSGIKRWTDGVNWSPSRILNNFLVYREIIPSNNPGEKKRALKNKSENGSNRRSQSGGIIIGSLTDSYDFKEPDGLVKKTISIKYNNINHHLVSYYTIEDALSGKLRRPSTSQEFCGLRIRAELLFQQQFRSTIS